MIEKYETDFLKVFINHAYRSSSSSGSCAMFNTCRRRKDGNRGGGRGKIDKEVDAERFRN